MASCPRVRECCARRPQAPSRSIQLRSASALGIQQLPPRTLNTLSFPYLYLFFSLSLPASTPLLRDAVLYRSTATFLMTATTTITT
jgi:hypothetical protein